jgi:hypothetical protein
MVIVWHKNFLVYALLAGNERSDGDDAQAVTPRLTFKSLIMDYCLLSVI